ncbi:hypothetical protein [Pedobacter sp. N23S346]|uniref:hypothetical protein n=1 Tax=Pedobacter sp. N23S346 TaxID=3402750 RepID=UPI003AD22095
MKLFINAINRKTAEMISKNRALPILALSRINKTKGITSRENKEKNSVSFKYEQSRQLEAGWSIKIRIEK